MEYVAWFTISNREIKTQAVIDAMIADFKNLRIRHTRTTSESYDAGRVRILYMHGESMTPGGLLETLYELHTDSDLKI